MNMIVGWLFARLVIDCRQQKTSEVGFKKMKLYIFGDSILKGVTFSGTKGRYSLVDNDYKRLTDSGYEISNLSRMGATIEYGEKIIKEELTGEGDTVLIEYGGNDCDFIWRDVASDPTAEHSCRTLPEVFERKYRECIDFAKSKGARVLISNLIPLDSEKYFDFISNGLDKSTLLGWLGDKSMLYRWQENFSRRVEHLAEITGEELVDLRGAFLLSHEFGELLSADGIHPTEKGHRLICDTVTKAVIG